MHPYYYTAVYKLIKRLSACKFVSRSEKNERVLYASSKLKRTERSKRSLEPCLFPLTDRQTDRQTDSIIIALSFFLTAWGRGLIRK